MITINDRFMTGSMYAPFCRTKHAPIEEWENDMKIMSELGYTCLHGFAEWHDIEYEKGHFDFTKIDHLVDVASKHGIVPLINVATQNSVGFYSPRWLIEELRGVSEGFVDALGQREMQSEYLVPCLDDPIYQSYAKRYLREVARHFAGDTRVGGFVLWGEPTMHSPHPGNGTICYCTHTKAKFREYLKEKYRYIEALNEAWGNEGPSDYVDFSQVTPPTGPGRQLGGFNSWEDWLDFMESNLAGHIQAADRIFKENGASQPTVTEMLPGINNGIDSWKLAKATDMVGISLFGKPTRLSALYLTVSDSVAKAQDKNTFVIEAGGGSIKFSAFESFTPSAEELKTTLLMRAGYGVKGVMFWCWRPRLSDTEGNDFGMCKPNGKPLARTKELGRFAKRMEELSPIYNSAARRSDVAIYMSQQINHLMQPENMTENYIEALCGANYMMTDLHINSDFICEEEILKGALKKYKVLFMPCAYILSEACAAAVAEFVKEGGHVIADYILAEKRPGGVCYTDLPGAGLDKVFGIEREDALFIAHTALERENTFGIKKGMFVEQVNLCGAKNIGGEYQPSFPLATENRYGNGRATYITTQYFRNYCNHPQPELRARIAEYLAADGILPYASLAAEDTKAPSALVTSSMQDQNGNVKIVTVTNTDYKTVTDQMLLPQGNYRFVEENENWRLETTGDHTRVHFTLGALQSLALYTE